MYNMNPWYPQTQPMTDIGQANSEQEAFDSYVQAGRSKIIFTADDRTVIVKSVSMNGQASMDIFDRREKTPQSAVPDYVTRDELEKALDALKPAKKPIKEVSAE